MSIPRTLVFVLILVTLTAHALAGTVRFVKHVGGPPGTGSTWADPTTLGAALSSAAAGDEIQNSQTV
ncbi:MAG: hypothetical protein HZA53_04165 [Planctomycetes bacterium]|nr:hypothetical protein [Planctomycetota bacterium]